MHSGLCKKLNVNRTLNYYSVGDEGNYKEMGKVTRVDLYKHTVSYINDELKAEIFTLPACRLRHYKPVYTQLDFCPKEAKMFMCLQHEYNFYAFFKNWVHWKFMNSIWSHMPERFGDSCIKFKNG